MLARFNATCNLITHFFWQRTCPDCKSHNVATSTAENGDKLCTCLDCNNEWVETK